MLKNWLKGNWWFLVVLASVFMTVGLSAGWLVGQSRVPAIPALLPLLVGLLGGFSYALFEKRVTFGTVLDKLKEAQEKKQTPEETLGSLRTDLEREGDSSLALPTVWLVCVILFSVSILLGLHWGIGDRVPPYPDLAEFVKDRQIPPEQRALLYQLEPACRSAGLSQKQFREVMETVIVPLLNEPEKKEQYPTKDNRLRAIVDGFRQSRIDDILRPVGKTADEPPPK